MQFTPKTEQELIEETLIPAGIYPFEVVKAEEKLSKSGNDMIVLNLRVFYGERTVFINDYLLEAFGFKLRHSAVTLNLEEKYNSGLLAADNYLGKAGWAKVGIKKDKLKKGEPSRELYPDQNTILDYVEEPDDEPVPTSGKASPKIATEDDDEIPF